MRASPAVTTQRRELRQQIHSVGGALLLLTGCLAALAAMLSSSPSPLSSLASSSATSRQLSSTSSSTSHVAVHVQIHTSYHKAATTNNATAGSNSNSTIVNATTTSSDAADASCGLAAPWEQNGGIFVYVFLLLYIFVALAIVCDDYFVSSLEKITAALRLSPDVAGATFMAAGSSAPELFVSLADNVFAKPQASLGIGTIVGSAIFNILIIISLSALLAGQVLVLDWRPLLRDSLWYCWSIVALTYAIWDGSVDMVESVLLFGSYIVYCIYMSQNERILGAFCRRPGDLDENTNDTDDKELLAEKETNRMHQQAKIEAAAERAAQLVDAHMASTNASGGEKRAWTIDVERVDHSDVDTRLTRQSSTGSSNLQHQQQNQQQQSHHHPHRLGSQSRLNPMFQSKYRMFQHHHSIQHHVRESAAERSSSTTTSPTATVPSDTSTTTSPKISTGNDNHKHSVGGVLRPLQAPTVAEAAALASVQTSISLGSDDDNQDQDEQELGPYFEELFAVPAGVLPKLWFFFTRPIVVAMRLTIPDCRYPIFSGPLGFTATFVLSIGWIAVLSHFTVVFATRFGCLAGIPSALMGLTVIAAGTSIPDALSSVLVARDGQGDMAVSNALGSNVFDILLGLGLPFFLSNVVYKQPVVVVTDDLELSIFILFGVLVSVVGLLVLSKWRLRKSIGGVMIVMYALYVVFSYLRGMGAL